MIAGRPRARLPAPAQGVRAARNRCSACVGTGVRLGPMHAPGGWRWTAAPGSRPEPIAHADYEKRPEDSVDRVEAERKATDIPVAHRGHGGCQQDDRREWH